MSIVTCQETAKDQPILDLLADRLPFGCLPRAALTREPIAMAGADAAVEKANVSEIVVATID